MKENNPPKKVDPINTESFPTIVNQEDDLEKRPTIKVINTSTRGFDTEAFTSDFVAYMECMVRGGIPEDRIAEKYGKYFSAATAESDRLFESLKAAKGIFVQIYDDNSPLGLKYNLVTVAIICVISSNEVNRIRLYFNGDLFYKGGADFHLDLQELGDEVKEIKD